MGIQELMTTPVITCRPDDTLSVAAQLMWEHDCGAIPVVADAGELVGMITDRDICMAAYTQGKPLHAIPVSHAMAHKVFACHEDEPVEAAERLMSANQIRRVPIVDATHHPIGILSLNDLARQAVSSRRKKGFEQEVTQTLAAICQPRDGSSAAMQKAGSSPRPTQPVAQA